MIGPSDRLRRATDDLWTVIERELSAAVRTRSYALLSVALLVVVVGVARAGGGPSGGYVPTVVDVLVVVEVLVPAVAFAVGYRAIVDARERGELAVLETYPLPPWAYVAGVYTGRAVALLAVVLGPLVVLGAHVATTAGPETTVFASHRGVDSPLLYVRFLALTGVLALVSLAVALALSAVAGSRRRAIVEGLVGVVAVVAGFDLLVVTGLGAGFVGEGSLGATLAFTPAGAFRGLVFQQVLSVAFESHSGFVPTWIAVGSLLTWTVGALSVAVAAVAYR